MNCFISITEFVASLHQNCYLLSDITVIPSNASVTHSGSVLSLVPVRTRSEVKPRCHAVEEQMSAGVELIERFCIASFPYVITKVKGFPSS